MGVRANAGVHELHLLSYPSPPTHHQSFGTEFNPQLYKQAMLALRDCSEKWACIKVCAEAAAMGKTPAPPPPPYAILLVLSLQSDPRVFFMDANIKDLSSLNPFVCGGLSKPLRLCCGCITPIHPRFTHVYAFNIGMPEDVVEHLLQTLPKSRSVKYAILYPHRSANLKRLQQIGTVRHSISMSMPGLVFVVC